MTVCLLTRAIIDLDTELTPNLQMTRCHPSVDCLQEVPASRTVCADHDSPKNTHTRLLHAKLTHSAIYYVTTRPVGGQKPLKFDL